jgi:alanyl-tRNA synthetase
MKAIPATIKVYYEESLALDFEAIVLDVVDDSVILDKTLFFPEGGGQPADTGFLTVVQNDEKSAESVRVIDVQEVEGVILHKIENGTLSKGSKISGHVDPKRRIAHKKHHTATHIVVSSARKVLGDHVWQAGAQKGEKRARIDIAHFKRISDAERREIEFLANQMVMDNLEIKTGFVDRSEAEQKYGSRIYQGGVPIGEKIRIVQIGDAVDVQACAGTHLSKTGECGPIKILRTERIQDGIERLEYAAGEAAIEAIQAQEELIRKSAAVVKVPFEKLPSVVERFFEEWKQLRKENERLRGEIAELELERLKGQAREISGVKVIVEVLPDANQKELRNISEKLVKDGYPTMLVSGSNGGVVAVVPPALRSEINASDWIKPVTKKLGGGGSGTATSAQGGGTQIELVDEACDEGLKKIEGILKKRSK